METIEQCQTTRDTLTNTESSEAYKQLQEIGRQKWPTASEATRFLGKRDIGGVGKRIRRMCDLRR
jgi:hypothetical protein